MSDHPIRKYSNCARPLEPDYPTNRAVLILLPLIGLAGAGIAYFTGLGLAPSALKGLAALFAAFLGWALARELAPDAERAAFLAFFAAPAGLLLGPLGLISTAAALFLVRVVNRSVGPPANLGDRSVALALVAGSVYLDGAWLMGLVGAVAFSLDASLKKPSPLGWPFAILSGAISAMAYLRIETMSLGPYWSAEPVYLVVSSVIVALALLAAIAARPPISRCDVSDERLDRARVASGLAVGALSALALMYDGEAGMVMAVPILSALLVAVIGRASR